MLVADIAVADMLAADNCEVTASSFKVPISVISGCELVIICAATVGAVMAPDTTLPTTERFCKAPTAVILG